MQQLMIDPAFKLFIEQEVLPHTALEPEQFWQNFAELIAEFAPRNGQLLKIRAELQAKISQWHSENKGRPIEANEYLNFLKSIDYIRETGDDFSISTRNVDTEIAQIAGPQLVVPLKNARFALNAANARWGSLYDALYGSDIIEQDSSTTENQGYDQARGDKVIAWVRDFLDQQFPLEAGSHHGATNYQVIGSTIQVTLDSGQKTQLKDNKLFVAFNGEPTKPNCLLLKNHGLHIEIQFDAQSLIGKTDKAGISDVIVEAAITTIMDCEDSIAAVDPQDKIETYRNWLGLMMGTLTASFQKGSTTVKRALNGDRVYKTPANKPYVLPGRCLLFNRNVGLLMTTHLMHDSTGKPVPENIVDAVVTCLGGIIDFTKSNGYHNSAHGSIYIVKPKMHGPDEVRFTCDLFGAVETMLKLPANTIKLGIMDEERRTTVNLKECLRVAKQRLVFINTGFLDRTGDEISTSMEAGAFLPKEKIKLQSWIQGYENQNVDVGLACGMSGKAQIGKGMWAMPDEMKKMMATKIQHPLAGANTAWVPSPTAAVLHALHYHQVDVFAVQQTLLKNPRESLEQILTIPLLEKGQQLTADEIQSELNNNVQGILGYVVRWVEMGIGCSKVPDIHNIGLMEDRATLRISAIHIANWLHHGICSPEQVEATLVHMAAIVDQQNAGEPGYHPMSNNLENSLGFQAAKALIFDNLTLPNGYTEPLLHEFRLRAKSLQ